MIGNDWDKILEEEFKKEYFIELINKVRSEYKSKTVFPRKDQVFNAFRYTPYKDLKVVILGQDPYHGVGEANGLCFALTVLRSLVAERRCRRAVDGLRLWNSLLSSGVWEIYG